MRLKEGKIRWCWRGWEDERGPNTSSIPHPPPPLLHPTLFFPLSGNVIGCHLSYVELTSNQINSVSYPSCTPNTHSHMHLTKTFISFYKHGITFGHLIVQYLPAKNFCKTNYTNASSQPARQTDTYFILCNTSKNCTVYCSCHGKQ